MCISIAPQNVILLSIIEKKGANMVYSTPILFWNFRLSNLYSLAAR